MNSVWNLLTGTATRYLLLAVNVGLGIFLMPFTVRHLGTTEYGLWMLVASMTAYFQLLDLGYGNGLVRHVSDADARGDVDARQPDAQHVRRRVRGPRPAGRRWRSAR